MDILNLAMNIGIPVVGIVVALIAIGLVVTRLYRRASKQIAFVRTGMGGQRVVVNGGCLVFPVLHETIAVNMNTVKLEVSRTEREALITRDRMRVDVKADFYLRVQSTVESIAAAAQTLGHRTLEPNEMKKLVEGKFVDGLRAAAAEMDMEALHEKRSEFGRAVLAAVSDDLIKNGLELEAVSLTALDQTSKEFFDPNNAFDAAGLTKLTQEIEERRKLRNEIERDTNIQIAKKDLESEQQALAIQRESEYARLEQEREIATRKAEQTALISSEEAQNGRAARQAEIMAERETEEARIVAERQVEEAKIERVKAVRLAEQDREIAVAKRSEEESAAKAAADVARAAAVRAEEQVTTARETEEAERAKAVEIVRAKQQAEQEAIGIKVRAETERAAAEDDAQAMRTRAEAEAMQITIEAEAKAEADVKLAEAAKVRLAAEAEGVRARNEAENVLSQHMAALRERLAIVEATPEIVRESVRPLEQIEGIKIVQMGGVGPGATAAGAGEGAGGGTSLTDQIVQSALRYRLQGPLVDSLLGEIGVEGSTLNGLVKRALDEQADAGGAPGTAPDNAPGSEA